MNEALSGVKGENSIKVFGPDLQTDERIADEVSAPIPRVPGVVDAAVYRSLGQPNVLITPDRAAAARYGMNVGDVTAVIHTAREIVDLTYQRCDQENTVEQFGEGIAGWRMPVAESLGNSAWLQIARLAWIRAPRPSAAPGSIPGPAPPPPRDTICS